MHALAFELKYGRKMQQLINQKLKPNNKNLRRKMVCNKSWSNLNQGFNQI